MPTLGAIAAETVTFADRHDRREYETGRTQITAAVRREHATQLSVKGDWRGQSVVQWLALTHHAADYRRVCAGQHAFEGRSADQN